MILDTSSLRGSPPGTLGADRLIDLASLWPGGFKMHPPQTPSTLGPSTLLA